jgi:hypothetical protein
VRLAGRSFTCSAGPNGAERPFILSGWRGGGGRWTRFWLMASASGQERTAALVWRARSGRYIWCVWHPDGGIVCGTGADGGALGRDAADEELDKVFFMSQGLGDERLAAARRAEAPAAGAGLRAEPSRPPPVPSGASASNPLRAAGTGP